MKSVRMKRSLFLLFLAISSFFSSAENNYSVFLEDVDAFPFIVVNKTDLTLHLIDQEGNTIRGYKISCAENYGNKERRGDHKTPEGFFKINQILNSSALSHDFGDGKGEIAGAYGPWFLRLDVPGFDDIGIHGTHLPSSIGGRNTEGCVRMNNEDITELKSYSFLGMNVIILPDNESKDNLLFAKYYESIQDLSTVSDPEDSSLEPLPSNNGCRRTLLYCAVVLIIALSLLLLKRTKRDC